MVRGFMLGAATALALAAATPAHAVVELQWWHAMTGGNNEVVVKLANDFNAAQSEYKVVPTYKGSYPDTMNAGIAAFRANNAPHIMQVFEVGTATMMSATATVTAAAAPNCRSAMEFLRVGVVTFISRDNSAG